MIVIENCNSLSDLRQKIIDGEEVRTARYEPCEDAISRQAVLDAIDVKAWEFCDYLISKNRNDEQKPVSHFADNLRECVREELPPVNPQKSKMDLDELKRRILMEVDGGTDDRMLRYCDVCDRISNSIDKYKEESEG